MLFYYCFCFLFSGLIFFVGLFGILVSIRSNFFVIISAEIMFLAINLNFFFVSLYNNSIQGLLFIIFIMVISAIEVVIFLSYFVVFYKKLNLTDLHKEFNLLKQ